MTFNPLKILLDRLSISVPEIIITGDDIDPPEMPFELSALSTVRSFLLDSRVSEDIELASVLGVQPISEEVYAMERRASDGRVEKVEHLYPALRAYAHTMTSAAIALMMVRSGDNGTENIGKWQELAKLVEPIVLSTLIGATAQMVSKNLLVVQEGAC